MLPMQLPFRPVILEPRGWRASSLRTLADGLIVAVLLCSEARAQPLEPRTGAAATGAALPETRDCSTVKSFDDALQVIVHENTLEVVSRKEAGPTRCAKVTLPHPGKVALVRDGVAYVSQLPSGLAIVDLTDPTNPRYDRTIEPDLSISSMRDVNGTAWILNTSNTVVQLNLRNLRPTVALPATSSSTQRDPLDANLGRLVTLRNGSKLFGRIVELAADQTLTLRLENGKRTLIPISDVSSIEQRTISLDSSWKVPTGAQSPLRNNLVAQVDDREQAPKVQLPHVHHRNAIREDLTGLAIAGGIVMIPALGLLVGGAALSSTNESVAMGSSATPNATSVTDSRADSNLQFLGRGLGGVMMVTGGLLSLGGVACLIVGASSRTSRAVQPPTLSLRSYLYPGAGGIAATLRF
jgi:hypothetical protein